MGLELYLDLLSQPCRAVYIFARRNRIPFELRPVDLLKGQHITQEFFRVNRLQKVPVLKDGDFILTESSAILMYLSVKYQIEAQWYPPDLQTRARVHEYLGWHADSIRGTFGVPLWTQVLGPLIGAHVPKEKVERNRAAMDRVLQLLEDKFLRDRPFLASHQVTLADLLALEELMQPVAFGYDLFEGRPRLAAWREQVEVFLGAELCKEAHGVAFSLQEQMASKTLPVPPPEAIPNMLRRISNIP
ncbi:PREDICTED: glutathione S-transferase theta-2-like isoform X1 [Elephantulus edwardii]|uniref:glutathione S-transferase theta-2-like isoform X1 n=1 Tax=Elephantulus edwardii TaxID=28737 RepID=UPI0003F0660A|nr:PREDICTED: glutathione S-transferase theta-2-like isoform X1 [Elephantulus edwardii]